MCKMNKKERKILAHDLGLHIEKLGYDGVEGWTMKPSEVIEQMLSLGLILEKLAKEEPLDEVDKDDIIIIMGISLEDILAKDSYKIS